MVLTGALGLSRMRVGRHSTGYTGNPLRGVPARPKWEQVEPCVAAARTKMKLRKPSEANNASIRLRRPHG
jgi:hypothetical protein